MWQDSEQIAGVLEATFNEIMNTRMLEMPLLNTVLSVQAINFMRVNEDWLGVLVTPWFMNLLLLPETETIWREFCPGTKIEKHFPYGLFEFTLGCEAQIGKYAQCSLFSPMFQFETQTAAVAAAQSALNGILATPEPLTISRRNLLRGDIGNGNH